MTILVLAHDEAEYAKLTIDSIRRFGLEEEIAVILIDNASGDGLIEWAQEQDDLSYVYMDEGIEAWGSVIGQVISEFSIEDDLLLLQSGVMIVPGALNIMKHELYSASKTAAVGCMMPYAVINEQKADIEITMFEEAIAYSESHKDDEPQTVMALGLGAVLLRSDIVKEQSIFDEGIYTLSRLADDIALNIIRSNRVMIICRNIMLFDIKRDYPESADILKYVDHDSKILKEKWGLQYYCLGGRSELVLGIDAGKDEGICVLEVGCDCGATLLMIKNKFSNAEVIGVELSDISAEIASHFIDRVYVADIEEENLPVDKYSVDYCILGDVLEHLHDPKHTIEYLSTLLRPNGKIIASIPNVMHISVMKQLLQGDFTYTDTGLLDRTNIHMFTFKEMIRMFRDADYIIEDCKGITQPIDEKDGLLINGLLALGNNAEAHMYTSYQYILRARFGFSRDFLKAECRQGFYIRSMMKRVWAVQISILQQIERICFTHGLHFYAAWGTLLGAVREKGYIPWDDDMDICMMRADFERFRILCRSELPSDYYLCDYKDKEQDSIVYCVRNSRNICVDKDFLERNFDCPYMVGVDIFIIDNIPDEPDERELFVSLFSHAYFAGDETPADTDFDHCPDELKDLILKTEELTGVSLDKKSPMKGQLISLAERISMMYNNDETKDVAMVAYLVNNMKRALNREWFKETMYLPFENIKIPVPGDYINVLKSCFGEDFMIPKQWQGHGYPYYSDQEKHLFETYKSNGMSIPESFLE